MWNKLAVFILKNRVACLIGILLFAITMGWFASKIELAYDMQKLVPKDDADFLIYQKFKETFGDDGNKVVACYHTKKLWELEHFNALYKLCQELGKQPGMQEVLSPAKSFNLGIDTTQNKFRVNPLVEGPLKNQAEVDSIKTVFENLKFYEDLLYNKKTGVVLIALSIQDKTLNSANRTVLIDKLRGICEKFATEQKVEMHYSGLPFVRHEFATSVRKEIILFTIIAFIVTGLLILFFFRSVSTLLVSLLFIVIGVVAMLGLSVLLGYKLTILTGTLPPLLVVIGVQNTIYLINKYHEEFKNHGQQAKALSRIISKIGLATLLINVTTAIGFGTFYFTKTNILEQYGVVAFLTINVIFLINIIGVPALYSFLPTPTSKQIQHLENKNINNFISWVNFQVFNHRRRIYYWHISIALLSVIALSIYKLRPLSFIVDDVPKSSKIYQDLLFFQKNFKGVMPFEIVVGVKTQKSNTSTDEAESNEDATEIDATMLNTARKLQRDLSQFPELSRPISLVELVSFANQVYNGGDSSFYRLPKNTDLGEIVAMIPDKKADKRGILAGLKDTTNTKMRISYQMADVGSVRMDSLIKEVRQLAESDKRFPKTNYDVQITGTSAIFLKGNTYLFGSLLSSTLLSLLIISLTIGLLFPSIKMILIAIVPNMLPLIITAGIMAFFHIPLKPSTILVYSIAFGITIDATIHFLSTFKQFHVKQNIQFRQALQLTINEVGLSMIYTMVALFAGFLIFVFSNFDGTKALGWLTAVTLFTGLLANLFLLPGLILSFEKSLNAKEELGESILELDGEN